MSRPLIAVLLLVPLAWWPSSSPANHHHDQGDWLFQAAPHGVDPELRRLLAGLDLSAEQQQAILLMVAEAQAEQQPEQDAFEARIQAHMALLGQPGFDETAARSLVEARQAMDRKPALARLRLQHRVMQVLTESQRAQVAERAMVRIERYRRHHGEKKHNENKA